MKEANHISPGYPVYTRVYIYITVLVIWYYRIIMITTRLLFILIMIWLSPLSLLSPLQSLSLVLLLSRDTRRICISAAAVIFKMRDTRVKLINAHMLYIHIYNCEIVACATIRRGWHNNDDSERDWSRSRLSFGWWSDPSFYECLVLTCEREERIEGLPFRIHELFTDHPPFG